MISPIFIDSSKKTEGVLYDDIGKPGIKPKKRIFVEV